MTGGQLFIACGCLTNHKFKFMAIKIAKSIYEVCNSFCITAWGGNIRMKQKQTLDRAIKYGNKLINRIDFNDIN